MTHTLPSLLRCRISCIWNQTHTHGNGQFICHIGNSEAGQIEIYYLPVACDGLSEFGVQTGGFNQWLHCTNWLGTDCSATEVGTKTGVDINFGAICKTRLTTGHDGYK